MEQGFELLDTSSLQVMWNEQDLSHVQIQDTNGNFIGVLNAATPVR